MRIIKQSDTFRKRFERMHYSMQARVERTIAKLSMDPVPPGLHVERVRSARQSIRSCKVDDAVRMIFEIIPNSQELRLIYVGEHGDAYRYASTQRILTIAADHFILEEPGEYTMFTPKAQRYESYLEDLRRFVIGADISAAFADAIEFIIHGSYNNGTTDGRAASASLPGSGPPINVIPADQLGNCCDVLVALCFDGDSFDQKLHEILTHVGFKCADTRSVIFFTSQWNPKIWKRKYQDAFQRMNPAVAIYLIGQGPPVRIV
jgi:mRNA-degrading endonuclease YafQ of YafQ-DinJ toxin-antitoxin module